MLRINRMILLLLLQILVLLLVSIILKNDTSSILLHVLAIDVSSSVTSTTSSGRKLWKLFQPLYNTVHYKYNNKHKNNNDFINIEYHRCQDDLLRPTISIATNKSRKNNIIPFVTCKQQFKQQQQKQQQQDRIVPCYINIPIGIGNNKNSINTCTCTENHVLSTTRRRKRRRFITLFANNNNNNNNKIQVTTINQSITTIDDNNDIVRRQQQRISVFTKRTKLFQNRNIMTLLCMTNNNNIDDNDTNNNENIDNSTNSNTNTNDMIQSVDYSLFDTTVIPSFKPTSSSNSIPKTITSLPKSSKSSLYTDTELSSLLQLHNIISNDIITTSTSSTLSNDDTSTAFPSLHDLILFETSTKPTAAATIPKPSEGSLDIGTVSSSPSSSSPSSSSSSSLFDQIVKLQGGGSNSTTTGITDDDTNISSYNNDDNNLDQYYIDLLNEWEQYFIINPNSTKIQSKSDLIHRLRTVRCIASDVDGTILSSNQTIHPRTYNAIRNIVTQYQQNKDSTCTSNSNSTILFFPATGKSRAGAFYSLGTTISTILQNQPGVFIQGLCCYDTTGTIIYEQKLPYQTPSSSPTSTMSTPNTLIDEIEINIANKYNVTLLAYDGDVLYANEHANETYCTEVHSVWGEPKPIRLYGLMSNYYNEQSNNGFHKLLLMDHNVTKITSILRPLIEQIAYKYNQCVITQAVPTMLEVLPSGCSKGIGVEQLCIALSSSNNNNNNNNINMSQHVVSIGDAENDITMFQKSSISIAVANACTNAKKYADIIMLESNNNGGTGRAIEFIQAFNNNNNNKQLMKKNEKE